MRKRNFAIDIIDDFGLFTQLKQDSIEELARTKVYLEQREAYKRIDRKLVLKILDLDNETGVLNYHDFVTLKQECDRILKNMAGGSHV